MIKGNKRHSAAYSPSAQTGENILLDYMVEQDQETTLPALLEAFLVEISNVLYGFITAIFGFELWGTFPF